MRRDTRYPSIAMPPYSCGLSTTRPAEPDPDLAIGLLRLAQAAGLRNRRGMVVSRDKPRRQRLQHRGRGREVPLQCIHSVELAFVVIKIGDVEAHLTLAGRGDLHQSTAEGQAIDGVAEHDAADQV